VFFAFTFPADRATAKWTVLYFVALCPRSLALLVRRS
jgi:hypothetical protein